jgi:plastocyanin
MYVSVGFTNESAVVVSLSTAPAGVLTVPPTVTIPAGQGGAYFDVTGASAGTAHVVGSAAIVRSGTSADIPVGQPKLQLAMSTSTSVGQKSTLTVYAEDSLGTTRYLAAALVVTLVSSDPTHTVLDSATITIPAGNYYVQTGVTFTQAGSYTITGSATGYASGNTSSSAGGALVVMSGTAFVSPSVTINSGQTVTWRNNDPIAHTTTSDTGLWDSGPLGTGATFARTFSTTGVFSYHCAIHPGMTATITVQP